MMLCFVGGSRNEMIDGKRQEGLLAGVCCSACWFDVLGVAVLRILSEHCDTLYARRIIPG